MEAKYTINGMEYTQTFLTLGDLKKLIDAVEGLNLANPNAANILAVLYQKNLHHTFFNAILKGEKTIDADAMDLDLAVEIIADFLSSSRFSGMLSTIFSIVGNLTNEVSGILAGFKTDSTSMTSSPS